MRNSKKYIVIIAVLFTIILPIVSFAQNVGNSLTVTPVTSSGGSIGNQTGGTGTTQLGTSATFTKGTCSATTLPAKPKLGDLFNYVTCLISNSVIPLIFALAVVMFVWGVVQYVINSEEEAKKAKGRQFMLWGIIALAVMVSIWGLVSILGNTFSISNTIPQVNTQNQGQ